MFNIFKWFEKKKGFVFSGLCTELRSWRLEYELERKWYIDFKERSRSLRIPKEEINRNIEKIFLDLENSDIEYIWKIISWFVWYGLSDELYLKFKIWKYILYIACNSDYMNTKEIDNKSLENLKYFCNSLDIYLNKEDSLIIFNEGLLWFKNLEIVDSFIVFWNLYLNLKGLDKHLLFSRIREYVNSFWKIILNKTLIKISVEKKELENYLNEIKIIWADNIKVAKEFNPLFKKTARLSEITEEIRKLNIEIQNIRDSIN